MKLQLRMITAVLFASLVLSTAAGARPAFVRQYAAYYKGSTPACTTCHTVRPKLNAYGTALKAELKGGKALTPAMFKACDAKAPKS